MREAAIQTIGRLMLRNPAHAMPPMRHTLVQVMREMEGKSESKSKRQRERKRGEVRESARAWV